MIMDEKFISDFQPIGTATSNNINVVNERAERNPYTCVDGRMVSSNIN